MGALAFTEYNTTRNSSHKCDKSCDSFCFVCGDFEISRSLSTKVKSIYSKFFGLEVPNQDVNWIPHIICGSCYTMLMRWDNTKKTGKLRFTKPMIWSAPSCRENCYFCMTDIKGFNSTNISYANGSSVAKPEKNSREWKNFYWHVKTVVNRVTVLSTC